MIEPPVVETWISRVNIVAGAIVTLIGSLAAIYIKIRAQRNNLAKLKEKEIIDQEAKKYAERELYSQRLLELQTQLSDCLAKSSINVVVEQLYKDRIQELRAEIADLRKGD